MAATTRADVAFMWSFASLVRPGQLGAGPTDVREPCPVVSATLAGATCPVQQFSMKSRESVARIVRVCDMLPRISLQEREVMPEVTTVLGPVAAEDLGVTLPHEHVFLDLVREYRGDGLLNDHALAVEELGAFVAAQRQGPLVDCTSVGLSRDPLALREVARATGLNIVMGCGYYRDPYLPEELDRLSVDAIADLIVRDVEEGADGTDVRAGIIGEIGSDRRHISALEERSFRAAARAHRRTGLTITTHAARWPVGLPQLDLLAEEGVDPRRVVIGHCDMVPDPGYHLEVARRGAFVQFDTVHGESDHDTRCRLQWVRGARGPRPPRPGAAQPGRLPALGPGRPGWSRATPTCPRCSPTTCGRPGSPTATCGGCWSTTRGVP